MSCAKGKSEKAEFSLHCEIFALKESGRYILGIPRVVLGYVLYFTTILFALY